VSVVVGAVIVFATFMLVSGMASVNLHDTWTRPTTPLHEAAERRAERVETLVSLVSAGPAGADCISFTVEVNNPGQTSVADFSQMDLVVAYSGRDGTNQAAGLQYVSSGPAVNQWTVTSITPDSFNPNIWNPEEKATLTFKLDPPMKHTASGTLTIGTPLAVIVSASFSCALTHYFHSETTDINATTYYQLKNIAADGTATTITSVFAAGQTGRIRPASNDGKFVFPLAGYLEFPGSTWTVTYRVRMDLAALGFVWFTNAHDISINQTNIWRDINLTSANVPAGATGAIVEVVNTSGVELRGMVRGKEDTRDYMAASGGRITANNHRWQVVKIDANRRIQGYITDKDVNFKLLGYTIGTDPAYFTVPLDVTPGITGEWTPVDVTANVDADADGVILLIRSTDGTDRTYGIREVLSSYSTTNLTLLSKGVTMYLVGLDAGKKFEVWTENAGIDIFLVGQTKGSVVYYVNDLLVPDPPFNSWQQLDADDFAVDAIANGLVFLLETTATKDVGLRHADSTDDWNKKVDATTHIQGAVGINDANQWDTFIEDTTVETFIAAYTRAVGIEVHADIDVLVRQADGTIRSTLVANVANSPNLTGTDWQTLTAAYTFPTYTVANTITPGTTALT